MPRSRFKEVERAYGFDEVALVPGDVTINPDQTNIEFAVGEHTFSIPVLASAMDAIVDTAFAIKFAKLGGLAVLNLEGVQTRYENPDEILEQVTSATPEEATKLVQTIYRLPIKEELIEKRVSEIKAAGVPAIVSSITQ